VAKVVVYTTTENWQQWSCIQKLYLNRTIEIYIKIPQVVEFPVFCRPERVLILFRTEHIKSGQS
jgi:hypothetical protein